MSLSREWSLLVISAKIDLMDRMSDGLAFSFVALGTVLSTLISLVFFKALYTQVPQLGGWEYHQTITLLGVYTLITTVSWASYTRGFQRVNHLIEKGDLDLLITIPVNLRSWLLYRYIDVLFSIPQLCVAIGLILYGTQATWHTLGQFPIFFYFLVFAFITHYSLVVMIATINFYQSVPQTLMLIREIDKLGKYPIDIYTGITRLIFSIIIPLAIIFTVPTQALFTQPDLLYFIGAPCIAGIFFLLSKWVWEAGLKKYESGSG